MGIDEGVVLQQQWSFVDQRAVGWRGQGEARARVAGVLAWPHAHYLRLVRNVQARYLTEQPAQMGQRCGGDPGRHR